MSNSRRSKVPAKNPDLQLQTFDAAVFSWGGPGLSAWEGMCNASDLLLPGSCPGPETLWSKIWNDSSDVGFYLSGLRACASYRHDAPVVDDVQLFVLVKEHAYKDRGKDVTTHWTLRSADGRLRVQVCNE